MKDLTVIILAAGKGTRLKSATRNKVVLPLAGKPMISYIVETLQKMGLKNIFIVVGFAKESVMKTLGHKVSYIIQKKRQGTGSAVRAAMNQVQAFRTALVLQGDDSALYSAKLIKELIAHHHKSFPAITLLTVIKKNPFGLGRIIRKKDKVVAIVEEKNANILQRKIREINAACYVFSTKFLKKYLPKIKKNPIKKEYYLTDLIQLASADNLPIEAYQAPEEIFMGVNTPQELKIADETMKQKLRKTKNH